MRELRAFIPQNDVLLGKPRDFRVFQSSLGTNRIIEFILKKNAFFLYEINFCTLCRTIF